jgi:hypothetical protein
MDAVLFELRQRFFTLALEQVHTQIQWGTLVQTLSELPKIGS